MSSYWSWATGCLSGDGRYCLFQIPDQSHIVVYCWWQRVSKKTDWKGDILTSSMGGCDELPISWIIALFGFFVSGRLPAANILVQPWVVHGNRTGEGERRKEQIIINHQSTNTSTYEYRKTMYTLLHVILSYFTSCVQSSSRILTDCPCR